MQRSHHLVPLLAAGLLCGALASCAPAGAGPDAGPDAAALVEALCAPAFAGRISGSEGNAKAADYIASYFEAQGLEPCFEGYFQTYEGPVYQPELAQPEVALTDAAGNTTRLQAGQDYLCMLPRRDIELCLPVSSDPEACRDGAGAYLAPDQAACGSWVQGRPQALALCCGPVRSGGVQMDFYQQGAQDGFRLILDEAYAPRLEAGAVLSVKVRAAFSRGTVRNVAAVRPGSVGKSALVFCAHFDGSGTAGGTLFPSALDNASGTAAMLRVAALLQQQAPQLENDVIFAAFNSEEAGMGGSQAFAAAVASRYETVSVINIDSVGLAGAPILLIPEENGRRLWQALCALPYEGGVQPSSLAYASDQRSFGPYANCPAVVFGGDMELLRAEGHIHTPQDQPAQLDAAQIEALAAQLAAFAAAQGDGDFADPALRQTDAAFEAAREQFWAGLQAQRAQATQQLGLAYNEGLCVAAAVPQQDGSASVRPYLLYGMQVYDSLDALTAQFPFAALPQSLGAYRFTGAALRFDHQAEEAAPLDAPPGGYVPGQVYSFALDPAQLTLLSARYTAPDGRSLLAVFSPGRDFFQAEPLMDGAQLDPALAGWELLGYADGSARYAYAARARHGDDTLLLYFEADAAAPSGDPTLLPMGPAEQYLAPADLAARLRAMDLAPLVQLLAAL